MGRLVDVDELMARISLNYNNHQIINAGAIKDIINTTRTAYDVEKVVAELEYQAEQYKRRALELVEKSTEAGIHNKGKACSYEHAIEIVRKGGVDHDR